MQKNILEQFKLDGRKAVVTGASGGIGRACAIALAQADADVAIHYYSDSASAEETVREIRALGRDSFVVQADVANYEEVNRMANEVKSRWGKVEILFNNAGICLGGKPETCTQEQWIQVMDINLNGAFYCAQAFGKMMIESGGGSIINTGSMSGWIINRPELVAYSASKAGIHLMTKGLACTWAEHGIRVNAIAPGYVATEMSLPAMRKRPERTKANWTDWTPQNRVAEPAELAGLVVYLASDASSFMTGSCIQIDGGFTCY